MGRRKKKKTILTEVKWRQDPGGYRKGFALRLFYLIVGPAKLKRLPRVLRRLGAEIPPGWTPADPWPPGDYIPPGIVFPPDWTPEETLPPGVTIPPDVVFPPDWTPDDPMPPGAIAFPTTPDMPLPDSPIAPTYTAPGEPGPPHPPAQVAPSGAEIHEITGETGDGVIGCWTDVWSNTHNAATGDNTQASYEMTPTAMLAEYDSDPGTWDYGINRSFLYFDLSALSGTISACSLLVTSNTNPKRKVALQRGTQSDTLGNSDYDGFTGGLLSETTLMGAPAEETERIEIVLNATGIEYMQSVLGGTAKLCLREYDHDYLNSAPNMQYRIGMFYADTTIEERKPVLKVTI